MRNARLDESQAGIKTGRRNINNLTYADKTTPMAESEEELKSLDEEGGGGEWKSWLKTKIMASGPITLWHVEGEKVEVVAGLPRWR